MDISVVLSTYQSPALLERTLHGYAGARRRRGFEIVIADDGSGPETAALIERARLPSSRSTCATSGTRTAGFASARS